MSTTIRFLQIFYKKIKLFKIKTKEKEILELGKLKILFNKKWQILSHQSAIISHSGNLVNS